ncbi:MAG: LytTR family transcriptional regulator, partial [Muribaculaceae bacterium]|nr:LytTR family transcriptional regulator [Muribaculaceae bacterium]
RAPRRAAHSRPAPPRRASPGGARRGGLHRDRPPGARPREGDRILYIQAMDNYVKIFIVDGKPVITQMSMKSLETMLPESDFVRVHKSYIVPRHRINTYSRSQLTLTGGTTIPVGRAYAGKLE